MENIEEILARDLGLDEATKTKVLGAVEVDRTNDLIDIRAHQGQRPADIVRKNAASNLSYCVMVGEGNSPEARFWAHLLFAEANGYVEVAGGATYHLTQDGWEKDS